MGMEIANSEYAFAARIDNIKEASKGNGILSGCAVTANATPDMFVDIAAGSVRISNAYVTVSLVANQAITAADGTNDRWDILEVGVNGTVDYTAGTAAANPMPPDLAEDHVLLATIFVENNSSAVETADIQDNRIIKAESNPIKNVWEDTNTADETTTETSYVDTTLSITQTTGVSKCLVILTGAAGNASGVRVAQQYKLLVDATELAEVQTWAQHTSDSIPLCLVAITSTLTAASHTFKLQFKTSDGSYGAMVLGATSGTTRLTVIELNT